MTFLSSIVIGPLQIARDTVPVSDASIWICHAYKTLQGPYISAITLSYRIHVFKIIQKQKQSPLGVKNRPNYYL
jgi:hypothetical protein